MDGWIKINRSIREHWIWQDDKRFKRWLDLVMMAAWETTIVKHAKERILLDRGQLIVTVRSLMHRWRTNGRYVVEFITDLEDENMVICERHKNYTIVTICKYDHFQPIGNVTENPLPETVVVEHIGKHFWQQDWSPKEEINNNINNSSQQHAREEKFFDDLKSCDSFFENAAQSLHCPKERLLALLDDFFKEIVAKETAHQDSSDFNKHFFDWARIQIQKNNGTAKQGNGGEPPQDRYSARRGTDVGNHKAEDYGGAF